MSSWAYCINDDCNVGISLDDYSLQNVIDQSYECPECGAWNPVVGYTLAELLQSMEDRLAALENEVL